MGRPLTIGSSVSVEKPDFSAYPRSKHLMTYSQGVILNAGDSLFFPEGWLIDKEMDLILREVTSDAEESLVCASELTLEVGEGNSNVEHRIVEDSSDENHVQEKSLAYDLEPVVIQVLHELVSLVHDQVNLNDISQQMRSNRSMINIQGGDKSILNVEDDRVAILLGKTNPHALRSELLMMAEKLPRTLEGFVLYSLSPLAAEVLVRKFEKMDHETSDEDWTKFYQKFYGAFDDQFAAMEAILRGKESFSQQAIQQRAV